MPPTPDERLLRWLAARGHPALTRSLVVLTWTGSGPAWSAAALALFAASRLGTAAQAALSLPLAAMLASLVALGAASTVKQIVRRPRPWRAMPELAPRTRVHERWSFPSGHTAAATATAVALLAVGHPAGPPVALWAALVGFSRSYLLVHYPSDVLAGAALGGLLGAAHAAWTLAPLHEWLTAL